ncbi:MAG: response regulator [Spirochaetales bacterium]|nr:response regulator [Spirochaetales bacterium]
MEDEEAVRTVTSRILSVKGYSVLNAGNASEAINICKRRKEDIAMLITDIIMPGGMSGPDLVKYLSGIHPEMKVLYISGYTEDTIGHHGVPETGTSFLQKPFTSKALLELIRSLLDM